MKLSDISLVHCEVKNIQLRVRGENRERTAQFKVAFEYSHNILEVITVDRQKWQLTGLWDEDQNPRPGIDHIVFSREHSHYLLHFARNNAPVMSFHADKIDGWRVSPAKGGIYKVEMRPFGVCSEGDAETLHKLLKDHGLTMTIEGTAQSDGLFD